MLDDILRSQLAPALEPVAARLAGFRFKPLPLILSGFLCGAVALLDIGHRQYLLGLVLLAAGRGFDVLASALARRQAPVAFEAYLDRVLDLLVTAGVPFAFALAQPERALAGMFLLFGLTVREGAQAQGTIGKSELFVAFALACIFPDWFSIVAYILGMACFLAAGLRASAIWDGKP